MEIYDEKSNRNGSKGMSFKIYLSKIDKDNKSPSSHLATEHIIIKLVGKL